MSDMPTGPVQRPAPGAAAIRALGMEFLIIGALAAFFGLSLAAMWPASATETEQARWIASQTAPFILLRIGGGALLLAALLAWAGLRAALFIALAADTLLLLGFATLAVVWGLLMSITGVLNVYILIVGVFAVISARDVLQRWQLLRATAPRALG